MDEAMAVTAECSFNGPAVQRDLESLRVYVNERAAKTVGVGVQSTTKPDQVTFLVASDTWVEVPIVVVVKPGLRVVPLARESQR